MKIKNIVTFIMLLAMVFAMTACKQSEKTSSPETDFFNEKVSEYVSTYYDENTTFSKDFKDETIDGTEYRIWQAEQNGFKFQIAIPMSYVNIDINDESKTIDVPDAIHDNYGYLKAQEILKDFPELGELTPGSRFSFELTSKVEANKDDLESLWNSYTKAKTALENAGIEKSYFVDVVIDEDNTVEFTPFDDGDFSTVE